MAVAGLGDVDIQIMSADGELETKTLRPTFRAANLISKSYGGYMPTSERVMRMEMGAYTTVIAAGLGLTEHGVKGLEERIFATGLTTLAEPLIRFIRILANGGKPPKDETEETVSDPLEQA